MQGLCELCFYCRSHFRCDSRWQKSPQRPAVLPAGHLPPGGCRPVCRAARRGSEAGGVPRAQEGRPRSEPRTAENTPFATRAGAWAGSCPVAAVTNCHTLAPPSPGSPVKSREGTVPFTVSNGGDWRKLASPSTSAHLRVRGTPNVSLGRGDLL